MRNKNTLLILIISTVTVFVWVGLELSKAYYQSTSPEILEEQIRSLQPDVDSKTLAELSNRQSINETRLDEIISDPYMFPESNEKEASPGAKNQATISAKQK